MLNPTEILIYIILEWKTKKIIVIDSSDDQGNKKRRMRKRKNKESIDEISQGLLIKLKNRKNRSKKIANCFSRNRRKKKKKNESKGRN